MDVTFDLIIRGGTLIDGRGERPSDVGIVAGRIAAIDNLTAATAGEVLAADGACVSAGWIDIHAHVWVGEPGIGVDPDAKAGVRTGVTTVVDAGSFGAAHCEDFLASSAAPASTRVLAYLNISVDRTRKPTHGHFDNFSTRKTLAALERDGGKHLVGVKVLASQSHCGVMGAEPVKLAVQAGRLAGVPVMCHIGNAPPVIDEVLSLLRTGDVVTHCWHGKPGGLLGRGGQPIPATLAAVERGLIFDIGHGSESFAFATARAARAAGLPLHSISTDLHRGNVEGPVHDQATTMSKFLHLGFSLAEVVGLSTEGPAAALHRSRDLGTLAVGREADVTVFRVERGPVTFRDSEGATMQGDQRVVPVATVRAGRVFRPQAS